MLGGVEPAGDDACRFEFYSGDAALNLEDADIVADFRTIVMDEH